MEIQELIKQLQILQVKYGQDAKVFSNNEVGSLSELLEIDVAIHENELKIILDS